MLAPQKGFFQIFTILILIAGIGITVYLTQFTQVFKPYASEGPSYPSLYGSTPICELNQSNCLPLSNFPKPSSGAVQTVAFLGFFHPPGTVFISPSGTPTTADGLADLKKTYLTKQLDYLWFDGGSFITTQNQTANYSLLINNINLLKALSQQYRNPNFKIGIHAGSVTSLNTQFLSWQFLNESNFLHNSLGSRISFPGQEAFKFLYLQNQDTRSRLANGFAQTMTNLPINGLVFDSYASPHLVLQQVLGTGNCQEAFNCKDINDWLPYLKQLPQDIKASLPNPQNKDIIYNGIFYSDEINPTWEGTMNQGFLNYTDGALVEHVHRILKSPEIFKSYIEAMNLAVSSGKKIFFLAQPQMFYQTDTKDNVGQRSGSNMTQWTSFLTDNNIPTDLNLERFYLTSYLLIQKNPYTYFGYHPSFVFSGDFDIYFYKDWNRNYGDPLGNYTVTSAGLYTRNYQNGFVVVNPTIEAHVFQFPDPAKNYLLWDSVNGPAANNSMQINPRQGVFLFNIPAPSSPSPSPSPSAPVKPGDTDNNGDIDIFDYNQVVTDFGKTNDPNTKADLDHDDDVDIFDYNFVVSNFGK